ncbi:MAG: TIGR04283 family arsenosugar biosynthesis glycosyltransferase [Gammaproteobacteria bacterium]|nr:TIGR04283 family arsenosugar biosynthesis glycosyltransferase [Gammaproteobacteria bacterium]
MIRVSIIIPALNESRALPATLHSLVQQSGAFEIIVVDGGSDDDTVALATGFPGVCVLNSPPGRGLQMNCGVRHASGDVLLFVHADTLLPAGAVVSLAEMHARGTLTFGGFRQQFSGRNSGLALVSRIHNWRCRLTGVVYGDQAMFVCRDLFRRVGGFPEVRELEDVRFSEAMLGIGVESQLLPAHVKTDSRKFEQMGVLRAFLHCLYILVCYELQMPLRNRQFFKAYR